MSLMSSQINELATALSKTQSELNNVSKDTINPFYKTKYATLANCWDSIRESLTKNGLSLVQTTAISESNLILNTMLLHSSGQWISSSYPIEPVKKDPQGYGSALSYARRYALSAIIGLAQEDDDGNQASQQKPKTSAVPEKKETLSELRAKSAELMKKMDTEKTFEEKVEGILEKGPAQPERVQLSQGQATILKSTCKSRNIPWGAVQGYTKARFGLDNPLYMTSNEFSKFLADAANNNLGAQ